MADEDIDSLISTLIAGGESYYTEFKSAWTYGPEGKQPRPLKDIASDIASTLVAFSNSDGGDLLVGVEDSGDVTGVPYEGDKLQFLINSPHSLIRSEGLGILVRSALYQGHRLLWFRASEVTAEPVVTADGRCLWRRGASSEPVPPRQIERRRTHILGDTGYESTPVPQASLDDLDDELIRTCLRTRANLAHLTDIKTTLRYWNLVDSRNGSVVLRRAALLLFAREPLRWHPNNRIRIRRVHGQEEGFGRHLRTREREIVGPIPALIRKANRTLGMDLQTEGRIDTLFSTTQILPQEADEECIVNAVAHRNYAIEGQAVEVLLYPERVEFRSPGRLPEPITIQDLEKQRGVHRSRNPVIMRVLRDLGWARDQGEGIRRIFGAMRQVELHEPELEEEADTFIIRLSTRSIYDELTQAWIASYGPFGLRPNDRKYMVHLRAANGKMSIDRLARQAGESFDETKKHLVRLERQGLVWRTRGQRTFHIVEATNVPHEIAYRSITRAKIPISPSTAIDQQMIEQLSHLKDDRSITSIINQWKQAGILQPDGSRRWRFGKSFLEYAKQRESC